MSRNSNYTHYDRKLTKAICYLGLWLGLAIVMIIMLKHDGGIDGVILERPMIFFGLLAVSVYLLATGLNNLISYFKERNP